MMGFFVWLVWVLWFFWFFCFLNSVIARQFNLSLDLPHVKQDRGKIENVALLFFFYGVICFYIFYEFEKLCTYFSLIFKVIFV